jgi:alpha-N-arabinofuranosidase
MYKVHQDQTLLPAHVLCEAYTHDGKTLPGISASASKDSTGRIHLSLCNLNPGQQREIEVELRGLNGVNKIRGEIITAPAMNACNDFGEAEKVSIEPFHGFKKRKNSLNLSLPGKSVVTLCIE